MVDVPPSQLTTESIADAAKRHGVNPLTIRRRISDGTLTAYRFGPKLIRIDPNEVDAALRPIPTAVRDSA